MPAFKSLALMMCLARIWLFHLPLQCDRSQWTKPTLHQSLGGFSRHVRSFDAITGTLKKQRYASWLFGSIRSSIPVKSGGYLVQPPKSSRCFSHFFFVALWFNEVEHTLRKVACVGANVFFLVQPQKITSRIFVPWLLGSVRAETKIRMPIRGTSPR